MAASAKNQALTALLYHTRMEKGTGRWALAAAVCALAAFCPSLLCGFVDWDDPLMLLDNPHFRGFTLENLRWMLRAFHSWHYHPLTWLSYAVDYSLWGLNPLGYHLTNLILHAGNAALVFWIARRLLACDPAAFAASLAFAVHPLRAESVVWITERRGLLSAFFLLMSLLAHLERRRNLSLAAYAASLLSKAMGVTFPAVLLILEYHRGRRDWRRMLAQTLPYFVLAAAAAAVGLLAQGEGGILRPTAECGLAMRVAVASYGLVFYLVKTVFPVNLVPFYPMPLAHDPLELRFILSAACVLALALFVLRRRKRQPWLLAAAAVYAVVLLPVLGLLRFGPQLVADRYSYLACVPWALLIGGAFAGLSRLGGGLRQAALIGAFLSAAGLMGLSWRQSLVWKDAESLWWHTARADPRHWAARNFLGNLAKSRGNLDEALEHYRAAVRLEPRYAAGHNNLGGALAALGRDEEALRHYAEAARLSPRHPVVQYNAAVSLAKLGRTREAAAALRAELKNDPDSKPARAALEALEKRGF